MPYYIVTRESVAFESWGGYAYDKKDAKEKALKAPDRDWEIDDIEHCKCSSIWEVEDEKNL